MNKITGLISCAILIKSVNLEILNIGFVAVQSQLD